jgi:hypothetical protein
MKNNNQEGRVQRPSNQKRAQLHKQVAAFGAELDRQRDARDIRRDRLRSAPAELLPMVF